MYLKIYKGASWCWNPWVFLSFTKVFSRNGTPVIVSNSLILKHLRVFVVVVVGTIVIFSYEENYTTKQQNLKSV